jgi:hypothetical protein
LDQVKGYLRITDDSEDDVIDDIMYDACDFIETETGQQMMTAVKRMYLDGFPANDPVIFNQSSVINLAPNLDAPIPSRYIPIRTPPLQSVSAVTYLLDGTPTVLSPSLYTVDVNSMPGRVVLNDGQQWPTADNEPGSVYIDFTCGYASATAVPLRFGRAIRWLVAHYYENRDLGVGRNQTELPYGLRTLLESLMFREAFAA